MNADCNRAYVLLQVLRDYNSSVLCFENTLRLQPDFEAAAKRLHAVKCHAKLEEALDVQHQSVLSPATQLFTCSPL